MAVFGAVQGGRFYTAEMGWTQRFGFEFFKTCQSDFEISFDCGEDDSTEKLCVHPISGVYAFRPSV
jgi:hypothetical protein